MRPTSRVTRPDASARGRAMCHDRGVRFKYWLDGPCWAKVRIAGDDQSIEIVVSSLTDAPRQLLDGLLSLIDGEDALDIVWARDPGDWVWLLQRIERDSVLIQLWEFSAWDDAAREVRGYRDGSDFVENRGRQQFETRATLLSFAQAVAMGYREFIDEVGLERYREEWSANVFPSSLLDALERWVTSAEAG